MTIKSLNPVIQPGDVIRGILDGGVSPLRFCGGLVSLDTNGNVVLSNTFVNNGGIQLITDVSQQLITIPQTDPLWQSAYVALNALLDQL